MSTSGLPLSPRIQIENLSPLVDCARYAPKRSVGDIVDVGADIFRDGHDVLQAVVRWCGPGEKKWQEAPMHAVDVERAGVRWKGEFTVDQPGRWAWSITAWTDVLGSWWGELQRKVDAGQEDLGGELSEGVLLLRAAAERAKGADRKLISAAVAVMGDESQSYLQRAGAALDPMLLAAARRYPDRADAASVQAPLEIDVDPLLARFGSWYELFPRSWGGLKGVRAELPKLAELGFDVLYLPPIHPIGVTNRKGRNNALVAGPDDPGSPWAIGGAEGGHTAVHPELGTIDDFDALVAAARKVDIEIALDFAIQCSADHPWLVEHPEWFNRRPDGTLKYAENPPKKYQDIYNVNFDCDDWQGLWQALLDIVLFWVGHGVRVFRVDNPHTKPVPFWEWLIRSVRDAHPEVVFLAEAFTRRAMMKTLAKAGFNQSYTYFTWKQSRWDLTEYVTELTTSDEREYFRPNFFVNTPDILTEELALGGPPKFVSRLIIAATLSPSYGVYSGYENFEGVSVRPGSEEYFESEKYEAKQRRLDGPLLPLIGRLNRIRRENPALGQFNGVMFLDTGNDAILAYGKRAGSNVVITVVSLDPTWPQEGSVLVPYDLGVPPSFTASDVLDGEQYQWMIGRNYVRLAPMERSAHILQIDAS